ncbi:unnamed protein product [Ambrosiozyma monospora]|uniref:Unnamed protein product n=1 Tax=Ambrosiozyma monospora TaxID=43982 RepID=A0A9W6YY11_AMBMO|nr:unnamed protein product [Ambrosiozyma monospora]
MSNFTDQLTTVTHEDEDMQMDLEEEEVGQQSNLPPHLQGQSESIDQMHGNDDLYQQQSLLQEQQREQDLLQDPTVNDLDEPRPNALLLKGVDNLDTKAIKLYVDSILKPDYDFNDREKYAKFNYKLEWINDESINIVFDQPDGALEALQLLSFVETTPEQQDKNQANVDPQSVQELQEKQELKLITPLLNIPSTQERAAQPYKKVGMATEEKPTQDNVHLVIRQSFYGDRKVKNAKVYSKYYLIHGEPGREQRLPGANTRHRRDYDRGAARPNTKDLITGEGDDKLDLIPGEFSKIPRHIKEHKHGGQAHDAGEQHGLFGYEGDNDESVISRPSRKLKIDGDKWKSDKYDRYGHRDRYRSPRDDRLYNGRSRGRKYRGYHDNSRGDDYSGSSVGDNYDNRKVRGRFTSDRAKEEEDLFPNFTSKRDRSPSRMEE